MRQEYHEQSQSRACFLFAVVSFSHRTTSSNWSCGCLCAVLYFCFLSSRRRRRRHRHRFSLCCCCWSERIFFRIAFLKNIHHHHHLSSLCYLLFLARLDQIIFLPWLLVVAASAAADAAQDFYMHIFSLCAQRALHLIHSSSEEELLNDPRAT